MGPNSFDVSKTPTVVRSELRVNWIDFQLLMLDFYIALGVVRAAAAAFRIELPCRVAAECPPVILVCVREGEE